MFQNNGSKILSNKLQISYISIQKIYKEIFEKSILNCSSEEIFLKKFINEFKNGINNLNNLFKNQNIYFNCQVAKIHKTPIAKFDGLIKKDCEIGDLLIVVKYHLANGITEKKSIIYQVKLSENNSDDFSIDANQLRLLSEWPKFYFSNKSKGVYFDFDFQPKTLEFGSFLFEPRNAVDEKAQLLSFRKYYGLTPDALLVKSVGRNTVKSSDFKFVYSDVQRFINHLFFLSGEPHDNNKIDSFINALYKIAGMVPDPPEEFENFFIENKEDGFAIIEINISEEINKK